MVKCIEIISSMLLTMLFLGIMAGTSSAAVPTFIESIKAKDGTTNKILITFSEGVIGNGGSSSVVDSSDFTVGGTDEMSILSVTHTSLSPYVLLTMNANIDLIGIDELTISCVPNQIYDSTSNNSCDPDITNDVYNAVIDTTRPQISSVILIESGTNTSISPGDQVKINFNEPMNQSTVTLLNADISLGLSNGHTFNASSYFWNIYGTFVQITLGSATTVANGDTVNPADTVTDLLENIDNSTDKVIYDLTPPTFTIQYYSDAELNSSLGNNPRLKAGTYYLKITSSEALSGTPTINISAEGIANDVTDNVTTLFSGNNYTYNRTIVYDPAAIGSVKENFAITGTDIVGITATNADPTNEGSKAAFTDTVVPTFSIQYYTYSNLTATLGDNPKLKAGTYYIKITSSEALSGTPTINISAEGTANDRTNNTTTFFSGRNYSFTRTITFDAAAVGSVLENISITGTDAANNTVIDVNPTNEGAKAAYTDTNAPSVNITSPTSGTKVNGTAIVSFTDNETTSPQCSIDNAAWVSCTSGVTTLSGITGFNAPGQGAFTLYLKDTDTAGNTGTDSEVGIEKDTNPPTVALTYSANPAEAGSMTITATYSEAIVGTPKISINQQGTIDITSQDMTGGATVWNYPYTVINATSSTYIDGTATVSLSTVADAAGNNAGSPTGTTFTIDTTPPNLTITTDPTSPSNNNGSLVYTFEFSENVTGFDAADITLNFTGAGAAGIDGSIFATTDANTYNLTLAGQDLTALGSLTTGQTVVLSVNMSGLMDIAGHPGEGTTTNTWTYIYVYISQFCTPVTKTILSLLGTLLVIALFLYVINILTKVNYLNSLELLIAISIAIIVGLSMSATVITSVVTSMCGI